MYARLSNPLIGSSMDVMTKEQLASIEEAVKQMEDLAAAGENFVAADAEFHRRLFEPLNNELLINLMGGLLEGLPEDPRGDRPGQRGPGKNRCDAPRNLCGSCCRRQGFGF